VNIEKFVSYFNKAVLFQHNLATIKISATDLFKNNLPSLSIEKSFSYLFIVTGIGKINVNFKQYDLHSGSVVFLFPSHLWQIQNISEDFKAYFLVAKKSFLDQIPLFHKNHKHVFYGVLLYNNPIAHIEKADLKALINNIKNTKKRTLQSGHTSHIQVVENALAGFMLDLDHVITNIEGNKKQGEATIRQELILKKFLDLLTQYYKSKHLISFYAEKLNITSHYLSLIVKNRTGQTANLFINEILFSEAKVLLHQKDLPILEVAEKLHFSDQSSFGKFFKRKSGFSPSEFQKNL
tara:strand:+ start:330 stop:1211 length:882 start_codon:yes stop_codon:yes gene_type:complete